VRITLALCLPRDSESIPVARHIVKAAMDNVGVDPDPVHDIEVALTEACTNVLKHSGPGDEYEVRFELEDDLCILRVVDTGRGFDFATLVDTHAADTDERGRGVSLMHALVDHVKFASKPEAGTIVHLEKRIDFRTDSLVAKAVERSRDGDS
jgi:serine/threonine-protein kinase RsbW